MAKIEKNIKQQINIFIRMEKNHGFCLFFLQKTKLYKSSNCLMNQKCIFMQEFFFQSNNTRLEKVAATAAIFCCSCHFTYHNRLKMKGCNFDALLKHFKSSKIKLWTATFQHISTECCDEKLNKILVVEIVYLPGCKQYGASQNLNVTFRILERFLVLLT